MLKSTYFILFLLLSATYVQAQNPNTSRVVFTVNLEQQEISEEGVFIVGNFFNQEPQPMESIGDDLYRYVISVTKKDSLFYNFKNGEDQTEILPIGLECVFSEAVGTRLLVVPDADSLEVDTVCYGSCLNCGISATTENITSRVKISVDLSEQEVPEEGIFVKGNFFNEVPQIMENDGNNIWSYTLTATVGDTLYYQFGKGMFESEIVETNGACLQSSSIGNRMLVVPDVTFHIPPIVCFGSCTSCQTTSTYNLIQDKKIQLSPTIITIGEAHLKWAKTINETFQISLWNSNGQLLNRYEQVSDPPFSLPNLPIQSGLYFLTIQDNQGNQGTIKLVIQ